MINRVVHVIDSLTVGGAQKLLITFAREAQQQSISCEIVCLNPSADPQVLSDLADAGAEVTFLPAKRLLDLKRLKHISDYFRRVKPDVVQTHLTYANILGGLAGRMAGIPVAATLHSAGNDRRYSRLREVLESWVMRFFDQAVIAVGAQTAEAHRGRLGGKTVHVVYNAVDEPGPIADDERRAIRFGWLDDPDAAAIISVGRFSVVKAYDDLIRAFAEAHRSNPHTVLILVGDGVMRPEWENLAAELGVSKEVIFMGKRHDVPRLLRASDLYVCSSVVEGMPLAVMEAMAASLPVIATEVGDLPTILNPECGVLVPPREPQQIAREINRLVGDNQKLRQMGSCAHEYAMSHFSRAVWFQTLLKIYDGMRGNR